MLLSVSCRAEEYWVRSVTSLMIFLGLSLSLPYLDRGQKRETIRQATWPRAKEEETSREATRPRGERGNRSRSHKAAREGSENQSRSDRAAREGQGIQARIHKNAREVRKNSRIRPRRFAQWYFLFSPYVLIFTPALNAGFTKMRIRRKYRPIQIN